jgi:hypothetical protein
MHQHAGTFGNSALRDRLADAARAARDDDDLSGQSHGEENLKSQRLNSKADTLAKYILNTMRRVLAWVGSAFSLGSGIGFGDLEFGILGFGICRFSAPLLRP